MSHEHISSNEIKKDIRDTELEIMDLERKIKGYTLIGDKMSLFLADGIKNSVKERREFITRLEQILATRLESLI